MYKSILVPLDGSEFSECSLEHVKAIAQGCQVAQVTLLTVIELPEPAFLEEGSQSQVERVYQENKQMQQRAMDNAEKYMTKASGKLGEGNINARTEIVKTERNQKVEDVILEYAKNNAVDLIIMSTHGRSGISKWAMGSVADRIVRSAAAPVLTIAPAGCRI